MDTKTDYNSTQNQSIKGKFVEREIITCFSYEMQEILEKGIIEYEDIENLCINPDEFSDYGYNSRDDFMDSGEDMQEIFEWWIVSDYLHSKLKEKGQPVIEWGNNCYWGRCCTGQAILLDGIISDICEEMEILEGQPNEWKV